MGLNEKKKAFVSDTLDGLGTPFFAIAEIAKNVKGDNEQSKRYKAFKVVKRSSRFAGVVSSQVVFFGLVFGAAFCIAKYALGKTNAAKIAGVAVGIAIGLMLAFLILDAVIRHKTGKKARDALADALFVEGALTLGIPAIIGHWQNEALKITFGKGIYGKDDCDRSRCANHFAFGFGLPTSIFELKKEKNDGSDLNYVNAGLPSVVMSQIVLAGLVFGISFGISCIFKSPIEAAKIGGIVTGAVAGVLLLFLAIDTIIRFAHGVNQQKVNGRVTTAEINAPGSARGTYFSMRHHNSMSDSKNDDDDDDYISSTSLPHYSNGIAKSKCEIFKDGFKKTATDVGCVEYLATSCVPKLLHNAQIAIFDHFVSSPA